MTWLEGTNLYEELKDSRVVGGIPHHPVIRFLCSPDLTFPASIMRVRILSLFACGTLAGFVGLTALSTGCQKAPPTLAKNKDPEVWIVKPITKDVIEHEDFTGHVQAIPSVDLRAQVTGYLKAVHFEDGKDVEKDALLFEIDPKTYATELKRAEAALTQAEARHERLSRDYKRVIAVADRGTITQEEIDRIAGERSEALAGVSVAVQVRELAKQNVEFTKIKAPFSGRMGKRMIDPNNLVKANDTVLATLVSLNPIHVAFDIDERTLLRLRKLVREGKILSARSNPTKVQIGLADEEAHSHEGTIDIIDNRLQADTGTLRVWAKVDNEKLILSPGLFVRVRLPVGLPKSALLIPEEALASDQGNRYVFALNEKDEVVYRAVKLGSQVEGMRVITSGISAEDRVIVKGLQRVRAGTKVDAKWDQASK